MLMINDMKFFIVRSSCLNIALKQGLTQHNPTTLTVEVPREIAVPLITTLFIHTYESDKASSTPHYYPIPNIQKRYDKITPH